MLALLSTSHGYLAAFLIVCFVIGVCLVALAVIYALHRVALWDRRRRHPEEFPARIEVKREPPCDFAQAIRDHVDLTVRHMADDDAWWAA